MSSHDNNQSGFSTMILLFITMGIAVCLIAPVSALTAVTIAVSGDQSYYLGEKVAMGGTNTDSDSTYLFITGPNLPAAGGKLTSPRQAPVSGDPGSFTVVKTTPDRTWEYAWYTAGLDLDAGTYTLYAASQPKTLDTFGDTTTYGTTSIIVKKPYIAATISSPNLVKGQPFTISGTAEGIPPYVQLWIVGDTYRLITRAPVNATDATYNYRVSPELSAILPAGSYYLIAQHPMADNQFDFVVSGDYVRNQKQNNGTNVFSLRESGAADALIAAISDQEANDGTYANDTYAIVPFQVAETGSSYAPAGTGVTLSADGDRSYYQGEKVVLRGRSPDAGTVYLYLTGPNLPAAGAKLTSPNRAVVSGDPNSFTAVRAEPDKTWEYAFYTANLNLEAGTYTVYAESQPMAQDQPDPAAASVGMALKKPFINATISSSNVVQGQPFTVTGTAEGLPPYVQLWIVGDNYAYTTKTPVHSDASFAFSADTTLSGKLPAGQNYLIVQHPMADNQFDFVVSGDYVRNQKLDNGTNVFRLTGPGSLQGRDAADALIAAISDQEANDTTITRDTYTLVPFQVAGAESPSH
jgi:hypothetical protein